MTPELGQGGCLALEDAVTLAALVGAAADTGPGLDAALVEYTRQRLPRTTKLTRRARSAARLNQASGRPALVARSWAAAVAGRLPAGWLARGRPTRSTDPATGLVITAAVQVGGKTCCPATGTDAPSCHASTADRLGPGRRSTCRCGPPSLTSPG